MLMLMLSDVFAEVWVLQGSCLDVQQDKGCSLAVPRKHRWQMAYVAGLQRSPESPAW